MRIKRLQQALKAKGIDLALLYSLDDSKNTDMIYLSGYEGKGYLAITKIQHFFLSRKKKG
jgi:hypothetical protein